MRVAAHGPDDDADDRELARYGPASWLGVSVGVDLPATAV